MTRDHDHQPDTPLSDAGRGRKREMLAGLESAVRWRGRRRTAGLVGAAVMPLLAIALAAMLTRGGTSPRPDDNPRKSPGVAHHNTGVAPSTPEPGRLAHEAVEAPAQPIPRAVYVVNKPEALARYASPPTASRVERLTDDQLLAELDAIGMPAGLIRRDHRVQLAFHHAPALADNRTP